MEEVSGGWCETGLLLCHVLVASSESQPDTGSEKVLAFGMGQPARLNTVDIGSLGDTDVTFL